MILKIGSKNKRKDFKFETNRHKCDFQQFETIRSFVDSIYNGKTSTDEAEMKQTNLLENIAELGNKSRPRSKKDKDKKQNTSNSINVL